MDRRCWRLRIQLKLNLSNFLLITQDSLYVRAYLNSVWIAADLDLSDAAGRLPIAYGMARAPERWRPILLMLVILPFWTSFLIRVYAWIGILKNEGLLNNLLLWSGLIAQPLVDPADRLRGLYRHRLLLPAVHDPAALRQPREARPDACSRPRSTSAAGRRAFWKVTLPLSMPGIIAGCMLVFIPAIGEFVIPDLLGGPDTLMIGRVLWNEFFSNRDWPLRLGRGDRHAARAGGADRAVAALRRTPSAEAAADGARLHRITATALILGFVFLYVPILSLMIYSFNESKLVTVWGGFSLKWYGELLHNQQLLNSAWVTLRVARHRDARRWSWARSPAWCCAHRPLPRPDPVRRHDLGAAGDAGRHPRPVAAAAVRGDEQARLAAGAAGPSSSRTRPSPCAYVTVVVQSRLVSFDRSLEEAAMDLGARPLKIFFVITLPIIAPALVGGWLLAFTLSLDDLVIASFVTGPGATTLPMRIYSPVRLGVTPEINAVCSVLIGLVTIGVIVPRSAETRSRRRPPTA